MKTLHRIFVDQKRAAEVVHGLEEAGFTGEEVSIVSGPDDCSAAEGAATGAVVGGGAGLLASLGVIAVPGAGPLMAAGWLLPVLAGGSLGAVVGGLLGALTDTGIPENDAHQYAEALRRGGALVIVRTGPERVPAAEAILGGGDAARSDGEGWRRLEEQAR